MDYEIFNRCRALNSYFHDYKVTTTEAYERQDCSEMVNIDDALEEYDGHNGSASIVRFRDTFAFVLLHDETSNEIQTNSPQKTHIGFHTIGAKGAWTYLFPDTNEGYYKLMYFIDSKIEPHNNDFHKYMTGNDFQEYAKYLYDYRKACEKYDRFISAVMKIQKNFLMK